MAPKHIHLENRWILTRICSFRCTCWTTHLQEYHLSSKLSMVLNIKTNWKFSMQVKHWARNWCANTVVPAMRSTALLRLPGTPPSIEAQSLEPHWTLWTKQKCYVQTWKKKKSRTIQNNPPQDRIWVTFWCLVKNSGSKVSWPENCPLQIESFTGPMHIIKCK